MQLEIGGKTRGLKFNQLALEIFTKHTDYETTRADLYACIYAGLRGASYVSRETPDYTFENVCDWCDATADESLISAYNEFVETQSFKTWFDKFQDLIRTKLTESEDKKKVA